MFASALITIICLSAFADDRSEVARWIERLGSEAFDDRVAAYRAIERMGPSALPALNAAAEAGNPRVRLRVRALIATLGRQAEADRFARPTLIRLDFHERPFGEVVDALNGRYGLGLTLRLGPFLPRGMIDARGAQPQRMKSLRDRVITLEAADSLPYWEAVDRLCTAATLHYDASPRAGAGASQGTLVLMADRAGRGAVSDSGPFRVQITDVRAVFERDFVRDPDAVGNREETQDGDLTVALAVLPEPGLTVHPVGSVSVLEAVDDRKRSLVLPAPKPADNLRSTSYPVMFVRNTSVHVNVSLLAPDPPGAFIRRLRGKVPLVVVARRADPIIVRLAEVVGEKSIETPDATILLNEVSLAPTSQVNVRVTIRPRRSGVVMGRRPNAAPPNFAAFNRDRVLERFELRDSAGRKLGFTTRGQMRGSDNRGFYDSYQLVATRPGELGPVVPGNAANAPVPSEFRYYDLVQTTTEVPFDLRDIPMP